MRSLVCLAGPVVAIVLGAGWCHAQGVDVGSVRGGETGNTPRGPRPAAEDAEGKRVPWHGSTLLFDQSVTTQTVGVGKDFQSRDSLYEWWVAFKPRYFLFERERDSLSLNLWMNLYLELTNSDSTTTRREPVLGPTSLWASYAYKLYEHEGHRTTVNMGPRMTLPTDLAARYAGQIVGLGANGGIQQLSPLRAPGATSFTQGRLGFSAIYLHPFHSATSPLNGAYEEPRQEIAGRSLPTDPTRAPMNVANSLSLIFSGGVQILPKLGFNLTYVLLNAWAYAPTEAAVCTAPTDCVSPRPIDGATSHRVTTWGLASVDYDVLDEMSLGFGYYNLTSQIGPDGQRRNPFWSPDARFFLTVTGNLDMIYERLRRGSSSHDVARSGLY